MIAVLVFLKIDIEARETAFSNLLVTVESLRIPATLSDSLLYHIVHRIRHVVQEGKTCWVYCLVCSLIAARTLVFHNYLARYEVF